MNLQTTNSKMLNSNLQKMPRMKSEGKWRSERFSELGGGLLVIYLK